MGQKGIVFTTQLSIQECANIFRVAAERARSRGAGRFLELGAKLAGNAEALGFYTPSFSSPFPMVDGVPDFAVGVNIIKFNAGAQGNGTHVHMYVDEGGEQRSVQLVSSHGLLDGGRSARLVRDFYEHFQAADKHLSIADGNI